MKLPEENSIVVAFPWSPALPGIKVDCEVCGAAVGIEGKNLPVITAKHLHVICFPCMGILQVVTGNSLEMRGRLIGGLPVDEIARDRARSN